MNTLTSKDIAKKLNTEIVKYQKLKNLHKSKRSVSLVKDSIEFKTLLNLLSNLYKKSIEDNYYFFDCPLKTYKNTLNERFENFKKENIDAEKRDFLKDEIRGLFKIEAKRMLYDVNYHFFCEKYNPFKITIEKKFEYLEKELKKIKVYIDYKPELFPSQYSERPLENDITFHDRYASDNLTTNQAIILLEQCGFFKSDKIINKTLADKVKILQRLIGSNPDNIKRYINKLNVKLSVNGNNYKKDFNFINSILDSTNNT